MRLQQSQCVRTTVRSWLRDRHSSSPGSARMPTPFAVEPCNRRREVIGRKGNVLNARAERSLRKREDWVRDRLRRIERDTQRAVRRLHHLTFRRAARVEHILLRRFLQVEERGVEQHPGQHFLVMHRLRNMVNHHEAGVFAVASSPVGANSMSHTRPKLGLGSMK